MAAPVPDPDRASAPPGASAAADDDGPVPVMQQVLDNPFLLLFLGVALPTVLYILWGVMEILSIPISPLAK